jgi:hypothetical protein
LGVAAGLTGAALGADRFEPGLTGSISAGCCSGFKPVKVQAAIESRVTTAANITNILRMTQ